MDIHSEEFKQKLAEGLRYIASHEGPYLIHCNEGKDRTGFVVAIVECLMGADADEVASDYMLTYRNYYGVEEGTDQYRKISDSFLETSLAPELGLTSIREASADLGSAAEEYLRGTGMTDEEITSLKEKLT